MYGALRGLETFSQIVVKDLHSEQFVVHDYPLVIHDRPTLHHRGLLLDTARHYFSLSSIFRTLDIMAFNKVT